MPCRMVWWLRANFSFQSYTILTRSYIIPGSLTLSLQEKGKKKDAHEARCMVNLAPRIFYLSPSREEEREPWE